MSSESGSRIELLQGTLDLIVLRALVDVSTRSS
jgi:hypothetical protein